MALSAVCRPGLGLLGLLLVLLASHKGGGVWFTWVLFTEGSAAGAHGHEHLPGIASHDSCCSLPFFLCVCFSLMIFVQSIFFWSTLYYF